MGDLTAHFSEREFYDHGRRPPAAYRRDVLLLCVRYLEPLRSKFGATVVNSGFRSLTTNHQVGGAPRSYHMVLAGRRGAAVDVHCARGTPKEWFAFLDSLGIPGLGLYPTHVHADNRTGHARW